MALNIPNIDMSKWGDFSDILQNIMQNRMKGQELAETGKYHQGSLAQQAKELAERTKHDQGMLGIENRKQGLAEKLEPLRRAALKAQIESYKNRESPEQKEERAEKLADKKAQLVEDKENRKQASKIEEGAVPLVKTANLALQAKRILQKNPGLTGMHNWLGTKSKLNANKDLYDLKQIFGKLQANLGLYASSRGGIQVLNWAKDVKPDIFNRNEANEAMLDSILTGGKSDFELENLRHKNKINKNLPFEFPSENNVSKITIIDSKGKEHEIDEDKFEAAKKIDPGVKKKEYK